jgi:hypothetical protein
VALNANASDVPYVEIPTQRQEIIRRVIATLRTYRDFMFHERFYVLISNVIFSVLAGIPRRARVADLPFCALVHPRTSAATVRIRSQLFTCNSYIYDCTINNVEARERRTAAPVGSPAPGCARRCAVPVPVRGGVAALPKN